MMLNIKNLNVKFEDKIIFNNLNLLIKEEVLCIMGQSGSGKTTLLRCIAGLQNYEGDIYFDQQNVNQLATNKRQIGLVTQNNTLLPHLNIYENLAFPLKIRGMGKAEIDFKINNLLDKFNIKNIKNSLPQKISGGEAQRTAIARAIIYQPKILLLDEPFAQLDEALKNELLLWLKEIINQEKILTIFVTHNKSEAKIMSSKIAYLKDSDIITT